MSSGRSIASASDTEPKFISAVADAMILGKCSESTVVSAAGTSVSVCDDALHPAIRTTERSKALRIVPHGMRFDFVEGCISVLIMTVIAQRCFGEAYGGRYSQLNEPAKFAKWLAFVELIDLPEQ